MDLLFVGLRRLLSFVCSLLLVGENSLSLVSTNAHKTVQKERPAMEH